MDIKDLNKNIYDDIDYTIVMDAGYAGPEAGEKQPGDSNAELDRLYAEYEVMCMREPTVLDEDDAYPRTYQWRMGDKYDPAKIEVLRAALKQGKKIADTEEYVKYAEHVTNSKFAPDSWD